MRIPYIILTKPVVLHIPIRLSKALTHHIVYVLRKKTGDVVTLANADGAYQAKLHYQQDHLAAIPTQYLHDVPKSALQIHLYQASCRSKKLELIFQKATELGVDAITIVNMARSQVMTDRANWEKKHARYQEIIMNASQQSQRHTVPTLHPPVTLKTMPAEGNWIAFSPESTQKLRELPPIDGPINICIGPEGGFSDDEYRFLQNKGFTFATFGPNILRTETAAIAAIANLMTLWG